MMMMMMMMMMINCCLNIYREDKENVNGGYWKMRCAKPKTVSLRVSVCKNLIHNGCTRPIFTAENILTAPTMYLYNKNPHNLFLLYFIILHRFDLQYKSTLGKVIYIYLLLLSLIFLLNIISN